MNSAADVWKDLEDRFSQGDVFRLSDLIEEMHSLKQGNLSYFISLKILWDEIMILRPLPSCVCEPSCNCSLLKTIKEY